MLWSCNENRKRFKISVLGLQESEKVCKRSPLTWEDAPRGPRRLSVSVSECFGLPTQVGCKSLGFEGLLGVALACNCGDGLESESKPWFCIMGPFPGLLKPDMTRPVLQSACARVACLVRAWISRSVRWMPRLEVPNSQDPWPRRRQFFERSNYFPGSHGFGPRSQDGKGILFATACCCRSRSI